MFSAAEYYTQRATQFTGSGVTAVRPAAPAPAPAPAGSELTVAQLAAAVKAASGNLAEQDRLLQLQRAKMGTQIPYTSTTGRDYGYGAPVAVKPTVVSTVVPDPVVTARAPIPFEGAKAPTVRQFYAAQVDAEFVPGGSQLAGSRAEAAAQARAKAAEARAKASAQGRTNGAVGFPGGGEFPGRGAGVAGGFPGQGVGVSGGFPGRGGAGGAGSALTGKRKKGPGELPGPEDGDDIEPGSVTDKVVKAVTSAPALVAGGGYGLYALVKFL